jgi:hypothetical protein
VKEREREREREINETCENGELVCYFKRVRVERRRETERER